jgi:C-terminal processing protease CtpA/Prc
MKNVTLLISVILLLFNSCRKDEEVTPPTDEEITATQARDVLYTIMNANYFWYSLMPSVTKTDYDDPYKLLDAMMYKTLDHWSFVADYDEFMAEMNGEFVGHGIRIGVDDSDKARIAMIYTESPLYKQGVRRGWIIKSVNGTDIAPILIANDTPAYDNVMGASTEGVTNTFVFQLPDGSEKTIVSTKTSFVYNSVLHYDTLNLTSGKAGHLVFDSFIATSVDSLAKAFKFFKEQGVKDLILDLRYNPGGYLAGAQALASFIAGSTVSTSDAFAKIEYNDKNTSQNSILTFKNAPYPVNMTRVVIITSRSTASASEAVINGLKPFINVVTIGDSTYGKPVGMGGWTYGKKYIFYPVTFKLVNKNGEGDYFDGLPPVMRVSDDITHDFSDRNELCLKESVHFLETGSVSTKRASVFYRNPNFSERPERTFNSFLKEIPVN